MFHNTTNTTGIIALFFLIVLIPAAQGNNYYVAEYGIDANPGSIDAPWLTLQHAADTVSAGDTVNIRGGLYNGHIHITNGGNPGAYIIFKAYNGEKAIIEGTDVIESQNGFVIEASYFKLFGIEIQNWRENAIWIENSSYFEISDCLIHDVGYGLGLSDGTHDFSLNRIEIYNFDLYGFDISPAGGADCYNGALYDCIAHTGRDPDQNVDGFAIGHGKQHNFTFHSCEAFSVYDGFDIGAGSSAIILDRCSVHDCGNGGFKIWGDDISLVNCLGYNSEVSNLELDWDGNPGSTTIQNCNFINSGVFNIWVENSADSLKMFNCIISGGEIGIAFEEHDIRNYEGDYNIFYSVNTERVVSVGYEDEFSLNQIQDGEWTRFSGQDAHSIVVDSLDDLFVNVDGNDYRLVEGSPAIDAGREIGAPSDDYRGNSRSDKVDIGAFEEGGVPAADRTPSSIKGGNWGETPSTEVAIPVIVPLCALGIAGVAIRRRGSR